MNDPAAAPVPRGERIAAALLAAGWILWHSVWPNSFSGWWEYVQWGLDRAHNAGQYLLTQPAGDLTALLSTITFLTGVRGSLTLVLYLGAPILSVGGLVIACGGYRRGRAVFWWLVVAHAAANFLRDIVYSRWEAVFDHQPPAVPLVPWYREWFHLMGDRPLLVYVVESWPYFAEFLLAAFVLGIEWRRRRREKAGAS